jgi:hypothetical protein
MTLSTMIIDMPIELGQALSEQEWSDTLQRHREAMIEELRDIAVTDERYAETERAARGLFWHTDVVGMVQ